MYLVFDIAILCEKTVYYMGSIEMRWDNITCSVQKYITRVTRGFIKALGPYGPLGFNLKPLVPSVKYFE